MAATILMIYIPVAMWYNKIKTEIPKTVSLPTRETYETLSGSTLIEGRFLSEETRNKSRWDSSDDEGLSD